MHSHPNEYKIAGHCYLLDVNLIAHLDVNDGPSSALIPIRVVCCMLKFCFASLLV